MFDEPFAQGASFIHRLDPRIRLILAGFGAVSLAVVQQPEPALVGLLLAATLLLFSRPPLKALLARLFTVNIFILFLWLTVPLTSNGTPLVSYGPFVLTQEGLHLATLVTIKSNAIVMLFLALVATMESPVIGHALGRLHCPARLVFLFLFSYRYLHVIADEWQLLLTAARLRGFIPKTNLHTYRTFGYLLGMVFIRSFDRSHRIYEAMKLRGFSGTFQSVAQFKATKYDFLFLTIGFSILLIIVFFDLFLEFCRV